VGKSTIFDIKRSRGEIVKFSMETNERPRNTPINGVLLMEKTRLLDHELHPEKSEEDFKASSGWLFRFKNRHRIRQLIMQGESLSTDSTNAAEEFKVCFQALVGDDELTTHQIFNWVVLASSSKQDFSRFFRKVCKKLQVS